MQLTLLFLVVKFWLAPVATEAQVVFPCITTVVAAVVALQVIMAKEVAVVLVMAALDLLVLAEAAVEAEVKLIVGLNIMEGAESA